MALPACGSQTGIMFRRSSGGASPGPTSVKVVYRYRGQTLGFTVHHVQPSVAWADFSRGWF